MQAAEGQTVILYYSDLRGQWPEGSGRALQKALPYGKRLQIARLSEQGKATLAGVALALRALQHLVGREIAPAEIAFPDGGKPRLQGLADGRGRADLSAGPDFSISHSGPWVGCAAVARGRIGFDIELGTDERMNSWAAREAVLKACGAGIGEARAVELRADGATYRGQVLHARPVELFPGASVCVMTSCPVQEINACAVSLQELFAPWSLSTETRPP